MRTDKTAPETANSSSQEYNQGFSYLFDPDACKKCEGNCCRMESGYVWVKKADINRISKYSGIDSNTLIEKYLIKIGRRLSIKEAKYDQEYPCIFFDMDSKKCLIYPVRPLQCQTFPFWKEFMGEDESLLPQNCPGILKHNNSIKVKK